MRLEICTFNVRFIKRKKICRGRGALLQYSFIPYGRNLTKCNERFGYSFVQSSLRRHWRNYTVQFSGYDSFMDVSRFDSLRQHVRFEGNP